MTPQADELLRYLRISPVISYRYAARRFAFDVREAAEELRELGYPVEEYPTNTKPYGVRLHGGTWKGVQ